MRLADVCRIRMGFTVRHRLEPVEETGVKAIQLRDVMFGGEVNPARLKAFDLPDVPKRYRATGGDVVFRSRGARNTASVIDESWNDSAVVISPLVLLRPNRELVTPRYLAWVINQEPAQRHFDKFALGTNLRMIDRFCLDALTIDVPDLDRQRAIVEIDALAEREQKLLTLYLRKKRKLISAILLDQIRKHSMEIKPEMIASQRNLATATAKENSKSSPS